MKTQYFTVQGDEQTQAARQRRATKSQRKTNPARAHPSLRTPIVSNLMVTASP